MGFMGGFFVTRSAPAAIPLTGNNNLTVATHSKKGYTGSLKHRGSESAGFAPGRGRRGRQAQGENACQRNRAAQGRPAARRTEPF